MIYIITKGGERTRNKIGDTKVNDRRYKHSKKRNKIEGYETCTKATNVIKYSS